MIGSYQSLAPTNRLYFLYRPFPLGISGLVGWEAKCPRLHFAVPLRYLAEAWRLSIGWVYYLGFPSQGDMGTVLVCRAE